MATNDKQDIRGDKAGHEAVEKGEPMEEKRIYKINAHKEQAKDYLNLFFG